MRRTQHLMIILLTTVALLSACNLFSPDAAGNAPEGHTLNKSGTFHKSGLDNPPVNCIQCHGDDLRGGTTGLSCFKCHGQKW